MSTILFFSSATRHSCRRRMAGVYRYFAGTDDIQLQVIEGNYRKIDVPRVLKFWQPIGCIAECGSDQSSLTPESFGSTPVVYLDRDPATGKEDCFSVNADLKGSAILAAKELLSLNLPHYGFVGFHLPLFWSAEREKAFAEALALNGRVCHTFSETSSAPMKRISSLRAWLRDIPKPCGLFAAFDGTAEEVIGACQHEHLRIPEDIAILGIDNNEEICEQTKPTLSSICPDFEQAGYLCAELLSLQLQNPQARPQGRTFPLIGVIRRRSTMRIGDGDPRIAKALEFIRKHACDKLHVEDVARYLNCSKRTAEMRFQRFVKHTIAEEIRAVRMAQVFALLRRPDQSIDPIANLCGYDSDSTLRYAFKAQTGLSMRAWRKQNCPR